MSATSSGIDPRGIITPDAFEVSTALLGRPLALPRKRLAALMIDLAVVGFITLVTKSFALILGVVAAVAFIRMSFRRTQVPGSVFGRAMRLSLGCLGIVIGIVTAIIWAAVGWSGSPDDGGRPDLSDIPGVAGIPGIGAALQGAMDFSAVRGAETEEEARPALLELAGLMLAMGQDPDDIEDALLEMVPEDAEWAPDAGRIVDEAVRTATDEDRSSDGGDPGAPAGVTSGDTTAALASASADAPDVTEMSLADAFGAYEELVRVGGGSPDALARMDALRDRLLPEVAADTLGALADRVSRLERARTGLQEDLDDAEEELKEEREGGFFTWLRNIVDELGFGFGWASLYLTVALSWTNGLTIGKKAMGIRVLRLDGEPITWWTAFERAGGYAAGFATGLLGFAQVFWDANRQGIHDRIVGTVVVVDGAEPVGNWEQAIP